MTSEPSHRPARLPVPPPGGGRRLPTTLAEAQAALAEADTIQQITSIRDKAQAVRTYARTARLGLDLQIAAAEIKLRAERKAGRILSQLNLRGGDRRSKLRRVTLKLADLGVSRAESRRWQLEASVPEELFEEQLRRAARAGKEMTAAQLLRIAQRLKSRTSQQSSHGVIAALAESLEILRREGRSYGCIFARPPWDRFGEETRPGRGAQLRAFVQQLAHLPVGQLARQNAHLHVGTANGQLVHALRLVKAWGFVYRSVLTRIRAPSRFGKYWFESHDSVLLGVRGDLPFRDAGIPSWVNAAQDRDLRDWATIRHLLERVSPGPYLELFGLSAHTGWTVLGPSPLSPGGPETYR